ncbi:MAG: T6SS immunity protein Tdi1 domain-containing protein [Pseudomonadota bacterium]
MFISKLREWFSGGDTSTAGLASLRSDPQLAASAFFDAFSLSSPAGETANVFAAQLDIPAGAYQGGLITVLGQELSSAALNDWRGLVGTDAVALASTACGDLFFWSDTHPGVYFLEPQAGGATRVGPDTGSFFNTFLREPDVTENMLRSVAFNALKTRLGELTYGECYIAVPLQIMGGSGRLSTFDRTSLGVYLGLAAQSVQPGEATGPLQNRNL